MFPWPYAAQLAAQADSQPHPDACEKDCEPGRAAGIGKPWHYHHACWCCGAEIIGRSSVAYECHACDVRQAGGVSPKACPTFDPDFAAEIPHP